MNEPILHPTYYVRHPDGSISIAEPQPTQEQIASQRHVYAQCDRKHGGGVCEDPGCHRSVSESFDEWWTRMAFKFQAGKGVAELAWVAALNAGVAVVDGKTFPPSDADAQEKTE